MNFDIAHQNPLFILSWNFILQVSAMKTENIEHDCQATAGTPWKTWEAIQQCYFMAFGVREKPGFKFRLCHLPCVILKNV